MGQGQDTSSSILLGPCYSAGRQLCLAQGIPDGGLSTAGLFPSRLLGVRFRVGKVSSADE